MDVLEIVRGQGRRLDAAEQEIQGLHARLARLEGRPAPAAPQQRTTEPAPREWLDPANWGAPQPPRQPTEPRVATPPREPAAPPRPAAPRIDLEELLGGRVLGLAGALAVLLGVAFLVAMAVDRGWVDEPTRIAIGFGGCSALLVGAVYLYERRGRTQAALAAAGAAVAGLFATLTAGAQLYELFPIPVALTIAAAIGAVATALALRWDARTFAALGLVGAMLAPPLVGAEQSGLTMAFLLFVLTVAVAVADRRGWSAWLPISASLVAAPQVLEWVDGTPDMPRTLIVLSYFWLANVAAAESAQRQRDRDVLNPIAGILVAGSTLLVAASGYAALEALGRDDASIAWLGALGAAHVGVGVAAVARRRASRDLAHLTIGLGIALGDIAFALAVDGFELTVGLAASAALLIALARFRPSDRERLSVAAGAQLALALGHTLVVDAVPADLFARPDDLVPGCAALAACALAGLAAAQLLPHHAIVRASGNAVAIGVLAYATAYVLDGTALGIVWAVEAAVVMGLATRRGVDVVGSLGAGALLGLALTHALTIDARPVELAGPPEDLLAGVASLGAVGLAALLAAQLLPRTGPERAAGHAVALLALAYVTAFAIDGPLVAVAWAVESVGVLLLARRRDGGLDSVGSVGAVSLLAFALLHGLVLDAAPRALVYGVDDLLGASASLAALAAAALAIARLVPAERRDERLGFVSIGAAALVYLGSVAIVTAFQPSGTTFEQHLAGGVLDERQQGQLLLSAFWALAGVGALVAGIARNTRAVRIGGFVLLGIATTKVFLFDLSTLESLYRVGSFVALGLLLLGGAFAWQRTRALREDGNGAPNGGAAGA
jgi:uncharacterized membrane protein